MSVVGVDRPDAVIWSTVALKHRHKPTARKVVVYIIVRQLDDTDPSQGRIHQRRATVATDAPSDANLMWLARL